MRRAKTPEKQAEEETPEVRRQDPWAVGASPSSLPPCKRTKPPLLETWTRAPIGKGFMAVTSDVA